MKRRTADQLAKAIRTGPDYRPVSDELSRAIRRSGVEARALAKATGLTEGFVNGVLQGRNGTARRLDVLADAMGMVLVHGARGPVPALKRSARAHAKLRKILNNEGWYHSLEELADRADVTRNTAASTMTRWGHMGLVVTRYRGSGWWRKTTKEERNDADVS